MTFTWSPLRRDTTTILLLMLYSSWIAPETPSSIPRSLTVITNEDLVPGYGSNDRGNKTAAVLVVPTAYVEFDLVVFHDL